MKPFNRRFGTEKLILWCEQHPNSAVEALFQSWALPGEPCGDKRMLRIGVRDGYLNFYVKGQSVAKLSCGVKGPKITVHEAYVAGRRKGAQSGKGRSKRPYRTFSATALATTELAEKITGWIETAETYANAEKRFVDELICHNPGIIDLEMGLPAGLARDEKTRVAPRMDIVLARAQNPRTAAIEFWEVKCSNNSELRAREQPKVIKQLLKYEEWLTTDRQREVSCAYRATALTMLALHQLFPRSKPGAQDAVDIWQRLSSADPIHIQTRPAIVVGNACPEGHVEGNSEDFDIFAQRAVSFPAHREKIERAGMIVHEVGPEHGEPALPELPIAKIVV